MGDSTTMPKMPNDRFLRRLRRAARGPALLLASLLALAGPAAAGPLRVCATTPDLGSLAERVGGDEVDVTTFVRGGQDPHFIDPRPSFIRALSRADLFLHVGLQLEIGWAPTLLRSARNPDIRPGARDNLDASSVIPRLAVPVGIVDRSMGDVHAGGNPHYLLDPVDGMRVARAIRDRLTALRPESGERFAQRTRAFETDLARRLVGDEAISRHGAEEVVAALLEDRLDALLGDEAPGGWLGVMRPLRGQGVVADHDLWPYFAQRFGIEVVGFLEPLPGITPTTRHLAELAEQMKQQQVRAILAASYFNPQYAEKLAAATGARVVPMANQVGARKGVDDYAQMVDWNVRHLSDALR